jgi:type II secretory pathway pseudopilin PulG
MNDQMSNLLLILLTAVVALIVVWMVAARKAREARYYRELYEQKQSQAFQLGGNKVMGDICQHLGTFAMLLEYDQVLTIASTSSQGSLDLLAIKEDSLDFIEFKKKGAPMQPRENRIKALVEQKRVSYLIKDVELPDSLSISDRTTKRRTVGASK